MNWFGKHGSSIIWKAVPLYLMWTIWRKGNNCTFHGVELFVVELNSTFLGLFSGMCYVEQLIDFLYF